MKVDLSRYLGTHSHGYVIKTFYFNNQEPTINTLVKGNASLKPEIIQMEEDFLFDIASLTKFIIAIITYRAVEEGLFSLNTKVKELEPKFQKAENVTILDLLAHRQEMWTEGYLGDCQTKDDFYNIIYTAYIKTPNRLYMDVHYIILGMLLEKVYNQNLSEILKEKIVKPLNLKQTTYSPKENDKIVSSNYDYVTKFYGMNQDDILDFIYPGTPHDNKANIAKKLGIYLGHAGIFTTAEDLLKILTSLIDDNYLLLTKESINKMIEHDDIDALNMAILKKYTNDNGSLNELYKKALQTEKDLKINKTYNYSGTRYRNGIEELNDVALNASDNSITYSGYTGPIFLIDFDKKIIVLIMCNVCHLSKMERYARKDISVRLVNDIYNELIEAG